MKNNYIFPFFLFISVSLFSQNVGIGTTNPQALFHLQDGGMRLEANNKYFDFYTNTPNQTGFRFYNNNSFKGAWFYNGELQKLNLTSNGNIQGLVYRLNDNKLLLGRDFLIGSESFGVRSQTSNYGGMYMETSGETGRPFYGYATDSIGRMWHYYDGPSESWIVYNQGNRLSVSNAGNVGIGTISPISMLHVNGDQWDLASGEGIVSLGSAANRLSLGMAIAGAGAGTGRIYAKGVSNKLILGGGSSDVLTIDGNQKRVGLGINDPNYTFDILSEELRALNIINNYSGFTTKYGARFEASSTGTGQKYGLYSLALGNSSMINNVYASRFLANGNGSSGSVYGVYSQVSSSGVGNHYGVYTTASTTNPSSNSKSWALYSVGNSYFSNEVRIGNINGAQGYKLSVDGKIMSEELKVQMSNDWPDYVFEANYNLKSTNELEMYIEENGHLPGVPSAKDVKEEGGIHVGEMNRILLEKVEELTLLLIDQNKRIQQLEQKLQK